MTKDERDNLSLKFQHSLGIFRTTEGILLMKKRKFQSALLLWREEFFLLFSGHLLFSFVLCGRSGNFFVLITNCFFSLRPKVKMTMKRDFIELKKGRERERDDVAKNLLFGDKSCHRQTWKLMINELFFIAFMSLENSKMILNFEGNLFNGENFLPFLLLLVPTIDLVLTCHESSQHVRQRNKRHRSTV